MTLTIAVFPISMFHMSANFSVTADKSTQHLSAEKKMLAGSTTACFDQHCETNTLADNNFGCFVSWICWVSNRSV